MPRAAFCSQCGRNVWLNESGDCANGHPRSSLGNEYEATAQAAMPLVPDSPSELAQASSSTPSSAKPNPWKYIGWGLTIYMAGSLIFGFAFALLGISENGAGVVAALCGTFWALVAYYGAKYRYLSAITASGGTVSPRPNVWKYIAIGMLIWVVGGFVLEGVSLAVGLNPYGSGYITGIVGSIYAVVAYNRAKCGALPV